MENLRIMQFGLSVGILLCFSMANAALLGASGANSSEGTAATIIAAPSQVLDTGVTNTGIQGFNEAQRVTTTQDFEMDNGEVLPAGSFVDSHMIFLNPVGTELLISHTNVTYTFSGDILGVMSDANGEYEAASTEELGADTTIYEAPLIDRGMESDSNSVDGYSFSGNILNVDMLVRAPGDWIRVVSTPSETPGTPATAYVPLLLLLNSNE